MGVPIGKGEGKMVSRNYELHFEFTDEEYEAYQKWCQENHLDGYCGAIGGSTEFHILPTAIGEIVWVSAKIRGKFRRVKTIKHTIRDL